MLMAAHTHRACPFVAAHYFDTGKVATVTAHENLSLTKSYLQSSSINLSDKNLGPSPILMLGAVLSTPSSAAVTSVDLSDNLISGSEYNYGDKSEGVKTFDADVTGIEALATIKVETLIMRECALGPKAITALSSTLSTAAVTSVDLSGNKIGGEGGTALVSALPSSNIKTLKIGKSFEIAIDEYDGTALDCSKQDFGPGEVIVVSWWLSTPATAAVTSVDISGNMPVDRISKDNDGGAMATGQRHVCVDNSL